MASCGDQHGNLRGELRRLGRDSERQGATVDDMGMNPGSAHVVLSRPAERWSGNRDIITALAHVSGKRMPGRVTGDDVTRVKHE